MGFRVYLYLEQASDKQSMHEISFDMPTASLYVILMESHVLNKSLTYRHNAFCVLRKHPPVCA